MKILASDGISNGGKNVLEKNGFEVITTKVAQNQLENFINEHTIDVIVVGNTTEITQDIIDACPSIKLVGKAGIEMDNIDVEYAIDQGLYVINTPNATANAIAELVFAHLFGMVRFLHSSNREMPLEGDTRFKELKKAYSQGVELKGKTLGIMGFGNVGKEVAKIAIGLGMNILATDETIENDTITIDFFTGQKVSFSIDMVSKEQIVKEADFISLHIASQEDYLITKSEFKKMKNGVGIINTAKGGLINEVDLINAIEEGKVQYAGLDVFETEPTPAVQLLMNPEVSLTPHIGAVTKESVERMGVELAEQIIKLLK